MQINSPPKAEFTTMKMNKSVATFALSLGLMTAPLGVFAKSAEESYLASYKGGNSSTPTPISVVTPEISQRHAGQTVDLEFTVNEAGKPTDIAVRQNVDKDLAATLQAAVAQWQFAPARIDGRAVARRVVLPLRIVDSSIDNRVAMN